VNCADVFPLLQQRLGKLQGRRFSRTVQFDWNDIAPRIPFAHRGVLSWVLTWHWHWQNRRHLSEERLVVTHIVVGERCWTGIGLEIFQSFEVCGVDWLSFSESNIELRSSDAVSERDGRCRKLCRIRPSWISRDSGWGWDSVVTISRWFPVSNNEIFWTVIVNCSLSLLQSY
jgi:hypothetical protein